MRLPCDDLRRLAQILEPAVGARADPHHVELDVGHLRVRLQAHVVERAHHGGAAILLGDLGRIGRHAVDGRHHLGAGAPGDGRRQISGVEPDVRVEVRAIVRPERLPVFHRLIPLRARRRLRPALEIRERLLVRRHETGPRAALDRHVADRHAAFHRHGADRLAVVLDDVAGAARRADLADDGENDVLRTDALARAAVDRDAHVLGLALQQRLRRQHVLDLRRADAVRQRAERAVRRRVAVAAHDRGARQREALLGPDHVHDALPPVELVIVLDAEILDVLRQRLDLQPRFRLLDAVAAIRSRDVVIDDGERLLRRPHLAPRHPQPLESLWTGHLVHQMPVDVEHAGAIGLRLDDVVGEDLVVKGRLGHGRSPSFASWRRAGLDQAARQGFLAQRLRGERAAAQDPR